MDERNQGLALLYGAAGASAAPLLGPFVVIFLFGLGGAAWQLSLKDRMTPWRGAAFVFRGVTAALAFTGPVMWLLEGHWQVPANVFLGAVAFLIAMNAELLPRLVPAAVGWYARRFSPRKEG